MDDTDLIFGLRTGDERALGVFMTRYRPALERIAGSAIGVGLRARITPDSVAQSVCRTFLRRMEQNPYALQDGDALWSLLCAIALTKVRERVRFHRREKRAASREVSIDDAHGVVDPGVGPEEALEQVLAELGDEERRVLALRLQDKTQEAIAAEVGCSERTVRRLLKALDTRLRERLGP
jgi:RNA polymerase sigma-70 factor (ECF subfamily)